MINCSNCIKVTPLPKCLEAEGQIVLTGMTLPTYINSEVFAVLHNYSSDYTTMWTATIDGTGDIIETDGVPTNGLDISEAYDLMNHHYKIKFMDKVTLETIEVEVNGSTGCCVDFNVVKGLYGNGEYQLTTPICNA